MTLITKTCGFLSIVLALSSSNVFAKTVTIACPTVKATLTSGYKTTSNGYEWQSWQSQPKIEVSTMNDKTYFAEICQSYKGTNLHCLGGSGNKRYGFFVHSPKITSCKLDTQSNKGFICEVQD